MTDATAAIVAGLQVEPGPIGVFDRSHDEDVLVAPGQVVPADRTRFRNLAIGSLLLDRLRSLDLGWPQASFDVEAEKQRPHDEDPL